MGARAVRAIALRYLVAGNPGRESDLAADMAAEYRSGYVLMRFFWDRLAEYERQARNVREYYPEMLGRLDATAELERWRRERESGSR